MANMSRRSQTRQAKRLLPGDVIFDAPHVYKVIEVHHSLDQKTRVVVRERGKQPMAIVYPWTQRVRLY